MTSKRGLDDDWLPPGYAADIYYHRCVGSIFGKANEKKTFQ
ncbi:MAG: hypothetical protein WBF33_02260 [Candidatus Nitrosopolaris sp.]